VNGGLVGQTSPPLGWGWQDGESGTVEGRTLQTAAVSVL